MKKVLTTCGVAYMLALVTSQFVLAAEEDGAEVLKNALNQLEDLSSYSYSTSMKSDLYPGSSGVMTRIRITVTGTVVLKRYGNVMKARRECKSNETIFALIVFRMSEQDETTTLWDGEWIYESCNYGYPFKMADCVENRRGDLPEDLYRALLHDESLTLSGRQKINGVECVVLESSAEALTELLLIDARAAIAINESTGFPVRAWASEGRSKTVIEYGAVQINPVVADTVFVPSQAIEYDVLPGLEGDQMHEK